MLPGLVADEMQSELGVVSMPPSLLLLLLPSPEPELGIGGGDDGLVDCRWDGSDCPVGCCVVVVVEAENGFGGCFGECAPWWLSIGLLRFGLKMWW